MYKIEQITRLAEDEIPKQTLAQNIQAGCARKKLIQEYFRIYGVEIGLARLKKDYGINFS